MNMGGYLLRPPYRRCEAAYFSSDVQGKGLAGLSWCRNKPELSQQTQAVKVAFDPLHQALPDFNEFTSRQDQTAACRGETSIGAGVGTTQGPAPDRQIFSDRMQRHCLYGRIWEASKQSTIVVYEGLP